MNYKSIEGLEYASPSLSIIEIMPENGILAGSENKGFVVGDYEEDDEF